MIEHFLGKYIFGSLLQLIFFILLPIALSRFSYFWRWSLCFHVIFCTFWGCLLSSYAEPYPMPFCSSFCSVWFCSHLECVDLYKVTLLCLWILCSILSVRQGTIRGLLASSKFLPLFVLLIFSTSFVAKLCVCNCLGQFLCLGPFVSMWSFCWSSTWVRVLFVAIYSFLVLVCHEWRWISITRNHVFHPGQAHFCLIHFRFRFE